MKMSICGLAVVVVALGAAGVARAQTPNPYYTQNPYVSVQAGVPYYPYPQVVPRSAGNLYGSAQVINAQTQQMIGTQQAKLGQQDVKRAKLENKRAAFDEWKYEQANTPSPEDLREKDRHEQLRRSRNDPPITEIWSGLALNTLLKDLQRLQADQMHISTSMLDPQVLSHVNVTGSRNDASLGLLREDGKLQWPYPLRAPEFDADRQGIDQLMAKAVTQAKTGDVAFDVLSSLSGSVDGLLAHLKRQIRDMPSNQWTTAKRYADQLHDACKTLQDNGVGNYFNGKWQAKGNTAEELVRYMTANGLRFAPATQGDETAYQSLYRDLVTYDTAIGQRATMSTMAANKPAQPANKGFFQGIFQK